jgi:uncharacterized protein (TIGR03067 family)
VKRKSGRIRRVKYEATTLAILAALSLSVALAEDFKTVNGKEYKNATVSRIESDTFRFPGLAEDATSKAGTFKLDATKKPKEIDSMSAEKEVVLGIYEMGEDSYKVCFAPAGKSRPSEFASALGNRQIIQVWERQKEQ